MNRLHNLQNSRYSFQLIILIMAVSILVVTAVSTASLYDTAFTQHRLRLIETVKSHARLIESIARFNAVNYDGADGWEAATLRQVAEAQQQFEGFGKTGEFALARREGRQIVFVLSHRYQDLYTPDPIPFDGKWAQPMRQALSGESGTMIGLDFQGEVVLAAFEPVALLDLGLVAKIDLSEIRAPFFRAGLLALGVALLLILIASTIILRITQSIAEKIRQQAEIFLTFAGTAGEGIILIDSLGIIQYVNPTAEALFGYAHGELLDSNVSRLMPAPHRENHEQYIADYLKTGVAKVIGTGRQLTAVRKDGSRFPMYLSIGDIDLSHSRLFTGVIMDLTEQQQLQRQVMEISEREQRRIGQELHDGLGQQLTGLGMIATSLLNRASQPEQTLATQLASGLKEAISQMRALSHGLVPVEIDAEGFIVALQNLTDEIAQHSNITIDLQIEEVIRLSDDTMVMHLYRIAQEAIHNAIKHAGAEHISVILKKEHSLGLIEIVDDGCGIPANLNRSAGLGLRIMEHRSGLFNGELTIGPADRGGTRVSCRFPITPPGETD